MEWEINDLGSFVAAIMGMMLCWNPMMFTGTIGAYKEANEQIKDIATYFKKEAENTDRKMKIFEEIVKLPGLSRQEVIEAGEHILKDAHKIDTFFALPNEFRRDYVMKQLYEVNPYTPSFDFHGGNDA
nr:twist-related protein [Ipomoea batatas]